METEPGDRNCFSVTLPLPQGEAAIQPAVEAVTHGATGPEWALEIIVEDKVNAMVVEAFVARMGHSPVVAPTAEEGLELLEGRAFDLALTDIGLPGIKATRRIRVYDGPAIRSMPVIAMSAHVFDNEVAQHLQSLLAFSGARPASAPPWMDLEAQDPVGVIYESTRTTISGGLRGQLDTKSRWCVT